MDSSITRSTNFHLLPLELRRMIWEYALPAPIKPALFPFESGHSHFRHVPCNYAGGTEVEWWWSHELLRSYAIKTPLPAINQESRTHFLLWLNKQDGKLRSGGFPQRPALLRDYDPFRDALFVSSQCMTRLGGEFRDGRRRPEIHRLPMHHTSSLAQVAIADMLLFSETAEAVMEYMLPLAHMGIRVMCIVLDPPADLLNGYDLSKRSVLYEMEEPRHGVFKKKSGRDPWVYHDGPDAIDPKLRASIDALILVEINKHLLGPSQSLEIRPVRVMLRAK